MPIAYVYTIFILRSIFLDLNIDMNWQYQGKDILDLPNDVVGFVYQITNTTNGRMYIGKKLARFKRSRKPLKGRVNKRRYSVDSDWKDYYGSSDELNVDIEKIGKEKWIKLAKKGKIFTLTQEDIQDVNNTDAGDIGAFKKLELVKQIRVIDKIKKGEYELPIIAMYSDGWLELIGGNTRLTAMIASQGKAKVWVFKVH